MIRVSVLNTLGLPFTTNVHNMEEAREFLIGQAMIADMKPSRGRPTMAVIYDTDTQRTIHVIITRNENNRVTLAPFGPELYNETRRIVLDINRWFHSQDDERYSAQPLSPFAMIHEEDEPVKDVLLKLAKKLTQPVE